MSQFSRREALTAATAAAMLLVADYGEAQARSRHAADTAPSADLPPAFKPSDLIVFQGDSITDGGRQRTGMDYNHIMGQDYCYIIAGEILSQYPQYDLTFLNRGISGNTVPDLAARWQTDTLDLKPNIVSILIGVNDAVRSLGKLSPSDAGALYRQGYDALIQQTLTALPGVRIVLAQPFVLPVAARKVNYDACRAQVAAMQSASEALSQKYNLPYVRYAEMMDDACKRATPDHWSWDGIHPTYAGHYLMHTLWLETINTFYAKT